jgi:TolA-binding protein
MARFEVLRAGLYGPHFKGVGDVLTPEDLPLEVLQDWSKVGTLRVLPDAPEDLSNRVQELKQQLAEAEGKTADAEGKLADLQGKLTKALEDLKTLKAENKTLKGQLAETQKVSSPQPQPTATEPEVQK